MEGILLALAALTPLHLLLAIFGGVVFGFAFKDFYIDARTIYLCLVFTIAFSVGRLVFVGVAVTATGTGLLGTFLFLIYVVSTIITRRILRRDKHFKL